MISKLDAQEYIATLFEAGKLKVLTGPDYDRCVALLRQHLNYKSDFDDAWMICIWQVMNSEHALTNR
jgi:hypothetical protein